MTDRVVKLSIRSLFLWAVMSIATVSLVISAGLSMYTQVKSYRQEIELSIVTLAKLIGQSSANSLIENNAIYLEEQLNNLAFADQILNVIFIKV